MGGIVCPAIVAIPAAAGMIIGIVYIHSDCNKPLAWWLITKGIADVMFAILSAAAMFYGYFVPHVPERKSAANYVRLTEKAKFTLTPEEVLDKDAMEYRKFLCLRSCVGCCRFPIFLALFISGWVWLKGTSKTLCDAELRSWTLGIQIFSCFYIIVHIMQCTGTFVSFWLIRAAIPKRTT